MCLEKMEIRGLISIEDCMESANRGLRTYFHSGDGTLIHSAIGDKKDGFEANSILKIKKKGFELEGKISHRQYLRQTKEGVNNIGLCFKLKI